MSNTDKPLPVPDVYLNQAVLTVEEWRVIQAHITTQSSQIAMYLDQVHALVAEKDELRVAWAKTNHALLVGAAQTALMRLALVTIAHGPFPEGMRSFASRELDRVNALKLPQCAANWKGDPPQDCDAPFCGCNPLWDETMQLLEECDAILKYPGRDPKPVAMILHCPHCHTQHVDKEDEAMHWTNPPHKSHLCAGCGHIWRPADVPTVGVEFISTVGKKDTMTFVEVLPRPHS